MAQVVADPKSFRLVERAGQYVRLQQRTTAYVTEWIDVARIPTRLADSLLAGDAYSRISDDAPPLSTLPPMTRSYLAAFTKSDLEDIGWDFGLTFVRRATKTQMVDAIVDVQTDDGLDR